MRAMDDPEIEDAVFEYTNEIIDKTLNDIQVFNKFNLFIGQVLLSPEVKEGAKLLAKRSLMDSTMLMAFANGVLNEIKQREIKFEANSARIRMINEAFQWKYEKFDYDVIGIEKLKEILARTKEYLPRIGYRVPGSEGAEFFLKNQWVVVLEKVRWHSKVYEEFRGYLKGVAKDFLKGAPGI